MSLNIYFEAQREVFVPKTGKKEKERKHISVWQTPTKTTFKILKADDPIKAYFDWVLEISEEVSMPIYADDDLFQEKPPIGEETYHPGEEHIKELTELFEKLRKDGYKITTNYI